MTREHFEKAPRRARWLYLFMRHPLTILLGYLTIFLHGMCMRPFVMKPREHWDCLIAVVVHAASAFVLVVSVMTHIYAAIWIKGTMRAMTRGTVTEGWAKLNHPLWHRKMTRGE